MRRAWVLLAATGCRQIFGLDGPEHRDVVDAAELDDAPDVMADTSSADSAPLTCIERWQAGPQFSTPTAVTIAASGSQDADPFTTSDEKTLYWSRDQQIRVATRLSRSDAFTMSMTSDLDSGQADAKVTVVGNITYLASARTGGNNGSVDIWHASRTTAADPWVVDQLYVAALNGAGNEYDPHLSSDALRLYYAPLNGLSQAIVMATRTAIGANWNAATALTELDGAGLEGDPSLTGNELVIVFSSFATTTRDLYYATRTSTQQPFGSPTPLAAFNTANKNEGGPHITSDGCELYFESNASGNLDIYVTSVIGP